MTRGILIVGNETPLTNAFAREAAKRVDKLTVAFAPNSLSFQELSEESLPAKTIEPMEGTAVISLPWNPGGSISSRALIAAAENRLGSLDEAVLVCTPASFRRGIEELSPGLIDTLVDDQIKGWFFLLRELTLLFRKHKRGTISLVLSDSSGQTSKDDAVDVIGPSIGATFRALTQSLLSASFSAPYRIIAFSSSEGGMDDAFAAYAYRIIDDNNKKDLGKWHRFGKFNLFGR